MYHVKTRNWHGKKWVLKLLKLTLEFGVISNEHPKDTDADIKFWLETSSTLKAWTVWAYFMLLKHWSGGWTYICRPGKTTSMDYKAIY
jgi:hypothetical protein